MMEVMSASRCSEAVEHFVARNAVLNQRACRPVFGKCAAVRRATRLPSSSHANGASACSLRCFVDSRPGRLIRPFTGRTGSAFKWVRCSSPTHGDKAAGALEAADAMREGADPVAPKGMAQPIPTSSATSPDSGPVGPTAETSPFVRLAWYASEVFGKTAALVKGAGERADGEWAREEEGEEEGLLSRAEAGRLLREDYDRSYFVTGAMTMRLYAPQCEFADPFVSFRGRDRFKQNVSNLGSFMEEVSLKVLDWQESEDKVTTKWRFSCVLALPWRPILAASGGTDHYFDQSTGKIVKHVERWDISPAEGVKQLLKPNPKLRKSAKA